MQYATRLIALDTREQSEKRRDRRARLDLCRVRGGGILRMLERGISERGGFVNEDAIEGEAPAVEQTRGKIGQTPFTQVRFPARVTVTNWQGFV